MITQKYLLSGGLDDMPVVDYSKNFDIGQTYYSSPGAGSPGTHVKLQINKYEEGVTTILLTDFIPNTDFGSRFYVNDPLIDDCIEIYIVNNGTTAYNNLCFRAKKTIFLDIPSSGSYLFILNQIGFCNPSMTNGYYPSTVKYYAFFSTSNQIFVNTGDIFCSRCVTVQGQTQYLHFYPCK